MIAERDGATRTFPLAAAVAAHEERGVRAAVEEEDRLVSGFESLFELFGKERSEEGRMSAPVTGAEVFDKDLRQDGGRGSIWQSQQSEFCGVTFFFIGLCFGKVFDAWGRAAEHERAVMFVR